MRSRVGGAVFAALVFVASCGGGSGAASTPAAPSSPVPVAAGRTFYVSPGGSDSADGLAPERAFATLQKAADATRAGDTVYAAGGDYTNAAPGYGAVLEITTSGEAGRPIRYLALPGQRPRIHFDSYSGIRVVGASWIEIAGFEVRGDKAGVTLAQAEALQGADRAELDNDGIVVGPPGGFSSPRAPFPTHVTIQGNHVHHCSGAGIGVWLSDYVTVQGNTVHSNAWYSPWAKSGISVGWGWNADASTEYKLQVLGNVVFDNEAFLRWRATGDWSDGNGIIIDSLDNHDRPGFAPYTGRTLVANNLVVENGGSGIHAFRSQHVDIVNNTAWRNARSPHLDYGSVFAGQSQDVRLRNNVVVAREGRPVNADWANSSVTYDANLYFGGRPPVATGPLDRVGDPLFVSPSSSADLAGFRLRPGSPALDTAAPELAPRTDIEGRPRPQGAAYDRGAFEGP